MEKILIVVLFSICFCQSVWEKGVGFSVTYSENKFEPGIGGNINYLPNYGRFGNNVLGLKLDIFISGMIYYDEYEEDDGTLVEEWDLNINQLQVIEFLYRRNLKKGKLDISIFPLQSSESDHILISRVGYKLPVGNNFLELFIRRFGYSKYPQIGLIYQW